MERDTLLVKGNIYCSDLATAKHSDSIIEKCNADDFKDAGAEIEGDLHIQSLAVYSQHLRVVATGNVLMNCKPESSSLGKTSDGTKEPYEVGHISTEGNYQANKVKLGIKGDKLYVHGNLFIQWDFRVSIEHFLIEHGKIIYYALNGKMQENYEDYPFIQVDVDFIMNFNEINVDGIVIMDDINKER